MKLTPKDRARLARRFVEPMKCLPIKVIPRDRGWLYELKFDGYRAEAICEAGKVLLLSRNQKEFNHRFPAIAEAMGRLKIKEAIFDGEIVALDSRGGHSFQRLQNQEGSPLGYYLFDLLSLDGRDLTGLPLGERKERLARLLEDSSAPLFYSSSLPGKPRKIWDAVKRQRLEGIVAKRSESLYEAGRRSGQWVKIKTVNQQEFVIGGFTRPQGSRTAFGALIVGVYDDERLRFCAKVGTGFSHALLRSLAARMAKLKIGKCPFANLPKPRANRYGTALTAAEMRRCTWIKPELVCEVQFSEWTQDGSLRHPAFLGLREDLSPEEVHREMAAS